MKYSITFLILFFNYSFLYCQREKHDYLKNNSAEIDVDSCVFNGNDSLFRKSNYKIYLSGEIHGIKNNLQCQLAIFKTLHQEGKVNCLVYECPYSFGLTVKEYLASGNRNVLKGVIDYMPGSLSEKVKYFDDLYKYYHSLPQSKKFSLEFIDTEPDYVMAIAALTNLVAFKQIPIELSKPLNKLFKIKQRNKYSTREILSFLKTIDIKDSLIYSKFLKKDSISFFRIISGLKVAVYEKEKYDAKNLEQREQFMYANFVSLFREDSSIACYGQFGRAHIPRSYQSRWMHLYNWNSLASRLNSTNSELIGSVCSIVYVYPSYESNRNIKWYMPIINDEEFSMFIRESLSTITIFNLEGNGSTLNYFADKFQYIIIDKN